MLAYCWTETKDHYIRLKMSANCNFKNADFYHEWDAVIPFSWDEIPEVSIRRNSLSARINAFRHLSYIIWLVAFYEIDIKIVLKSVFSRSY